MLVVLRVKEIPPSQWRNFCLCVFSIVQKLLLVLLVVFSSILARAQALGGTSVFNFTKISNTPQLTALGGINISQVTDDIGLAFHNPALLRPSMHTQINAVFNSLPASVENYHVQGGYYLAKQETMLSMGIQYFSYGSIAQTDAAGNLLGEFKPNDYVIQFAGARQYGDHWNYGASLKFIYSSYGAYRSSGIAADAGLTYTDTALLLQAGFVLKNMGVQLKAYDGTSKDQLPFDMQLGISKRLAKAPIQLSLTLHHLHQFDIMYDDTSFNNENGYPGGSSFANKFFSHFVFGTQVFITDKIEISAGYNYLRRKELNTGSTGNGLNGFSFGVGILVRKIQIRYARTHYQSNQANNQFGISFSFQQPPQ